MSKKITWQIEKRKLSELNPYAHNPRKLTDQGMADLKKSLDKFGLAEPIVINQDNTIIGGHARFFTLLNADDTLFVDCYIPSILLTPKEVQELNVRLNKNVAGEFDFDILAENFEFDDLVNWGFGKDELDASKWGVQKTEEELDDAPEPQKTAVSRLGDIFLLDGKHRVMCGDSTKIEVVEILMDNSKADCVVTDPPYNTGMTGKPDNAKARLSHMFNDKIEDWSDFLKNIFLNYMKVTKGDCAFYVFIDWRKVADIKQCMESFMDVKNVIVWDKQVHGLGSDYKSTYEHCVVGKKGKPEINNRFGLDYQDIWRLQRQMGRNKDHATAKPIELIAKPIKHASKSDDIILDLFLGSGSTLIACEQTNRICYGMEIDPIYVDVILRRYYNLYPEKKIECLTRNDFNLSELFNNA